MKVKKYTYSYKIYDIKDNTKNKLKLDVYAIENDGVFVIKDKKLNIEVSGSSVEECKEFFDEKVYLMIKEAIDKGYISEFIEAWNL